jgi:hypothetical protein
MFGWDLEKGTVEVLGKGDTPITFTDRQDVARFLSHALLEFPRSELEWSEFHLEGERVVSLEFEPDINLTSSPDGQPTHRAI